MRIVILLKPLRPNPSAQYADDLSLSERVALQHALTLKERGAHELVALCVAGPDADPLLARVCALGVDRAFRVWPESRSGRVIDGNLRAVAELLACALRHIGCVLTLAGQRSGDWQTGMTPPMVAQALGVSYLAEAGVVEMGDSGDAEATVLRHGQALRVRIGLPALVTFRPCVYAVELPAAPRAEPHPITVLTPEELAFEGDDVLPWPEEAARPLTPAAPEILANGAAMLALLRRLGAVS